MEKIIQAIADGNNTVPYQWAELRSLLIKEIEEIAQKSDDQQGIKANMDFIRKSLDSYEKYIHFEDHIIDILISLVLRILFKGYASLYQSHPVVKMHII